MTLNQKYEQYNDTAHTVFQGLSHTAFSRYTAIYYLAIYYLGECGHRDENSWTNSSNLRLPLPSLENTWKDGIKKFVVYAIIIV